MRSLIPESAPETPWQEFVRSFRANRGAVVSLAVLVSACGIALFAGILSPHDPLAVNTELLRMPPAWQAEGSFRHLLGTDDVGRDVLSRLIYGARVSLGVGALVVVLATAIGTVLGLISGYFGGWVDGIVMRLVDWMMSLPSILFAIVVVTVLGPGLLNAILASALVAVPGFIRVVRGTVMAEKSKPYVLAARSYGAGHARILFLEILPNSMAPLIVQASHGFSDGILNVAALGFLGLGAQAPTPEWGTMLSDARAFIESSPWLVTLPGLCIVMVVLGFNLMGDGLRDALDPKLKN